jgi:MFS family permease
MLTFIRLNYSNAYGLQADTNMKGDNYSWVASGQYFGTILGAYPANWALQRFPVGKLLGYMCFTWGIVCMLQAAVFNFGGFMAIRIVMGFVEACVAPACVLLTMSMWTRDEQPWRCNFWIGTNGVASMIGALLAFGLGHANGLAVPNWKLIYLVVGAMTIAWAVVISLYLPDGPHNAKMLTEYERIVAVWRISKNKTGIKHTKLLPYQMKEAVTDLKTWLVLLSGAALGILNGSVTTFMSTLIKGFGFDSLKTSLMQMPGGAFEVVWCFAFGYIGTFKNCMGASLLCE